MTYNNDTIDDLTQFCCDHDDEEWGAEPTKAERPSSLRPPAQHPRLTYGVGLAIAFTAAVVASAVWLCFG